MALQRIAATVVVVVALGLAWAPLPARGVERWYSNGVYASVQPILTRATNAVPVSMLDVVGLAAAALGVSSIAGRMRRASRGRRLRALLRAVPPLVAIAAGLYLVFLALWGFNYSRPPLVSRAAPGTRVGADDVERVATMAVDGLNGLHAAAHAAPWPPATHLPIDLADAFASAQQSLGSPWRAIPGVPKPTLLAPYFRWAAVAGMTNPFGLDVIIAPDALPFEQAGILTHEWGHLAGFAREADAGFVGWLTCMAGPAQAQYSGWLDLYPRALGSLSADRRSRVAARLAEGPRADYRAIAERLRRASPRVMHVAWTGYDAFLKTQRVEGGVANYDEVVTLVAIHVSRRTR